MAPAANLQLEQPGDLERIVKEHWRLDAFKRFQCVWLARMFDLRAEDIAAALQLHVTTVRRIQAAYERNGSAAIEGRGNRGGRRRHYLDFEEETAFLNAYARSAKRGRLCTVNGLKASFEARIGRKVNKTTIYRLLERHGWGALATRLHYPPQRATEAISAAS